MSRSDSWNKDVPSKPVIAPVGAGKCVTDLAISEVTSPFFEDDPRQAIADRIAELSKRPSLERGTLEAIYDSLTMRESQ